MSHNELRRFVLFLGRKTANRDKPLQKKSLAHALKRFLQQSGKCGKMDFWESKVLKSSIYRIMFCLPGIWENVKFIFFFALPAKIYHQIYITIKQHTYVDFFPHIPYTPFFHLSFFIFPDSRFCKYIVLQALIPLIFIFPAHSQIFHRHILLCFNLLRIFPDFRSFLFRR